jgi:hypothetical protein
MLMRGKFKKKKKNKKQKHADWVSNKPNIGGKFE